MKAEHIVQHVKKTYSAIAQEFDASRKKNPWPEFEELFRKEGKMKNNKKLKVLDVACGNGRLYSFLKSYTGIKYYGVDFNPALVKIAKKNHTHARFQMAEMTKLPLPAHSFDSVWCIAALHHLPTKLLQQKALKEMKRVLLPGGSLVITAWNLWQPKYRKYIKKSTAWIPWGKTIHKRFYYAFTEKELIALIKTVKFHRIKKIKSRHNIALIAYS